MKSLVESLPAQIAELEKSRGSESRFVKMLKEQLRASIATQGQSAQQVFMAQAQTFPVKSEQAQPDPMQGAEKMQTQPDYESLVKQAESNLRDGWECHILRGMLKDRTPLTRERYLAEAWLVEPEELDAEFEYELIPPMFRRAS